MTLTDLKFAKRLASLLEPVSLVARARKIEEFRQVVRRNLRKQYISFYKHQHAMPLLPEEK